MAIKISGTTVIDDSRNISNTGVITATSFVGDGSGLTGVVVTGIGSTRSVNTTGIITASIVSANQFVGSGDKLIFSPTATSFSPSQGATNIGITTSISITFDQLIYAGVGTITLRNSSGIGTIIQSIGIGSTSVSINNQTLTITPSTLPISTNVFVVLPQGVIKNSVGGNISTISTYSFTTASFVLSSINPGSGSTNIGLSTSITLSFSSTPIRGTGTVELKSGSATTGTLIESFNAATSTRITTSGNNWILTPTSNLAINTTYFTIIPSTAITNFVGLNTTGGTSHSFTTRPLGLGDSFGGGVLICQAGGTRWVISPDAAEVSRIWTSRADSNTVAQQVSGCTGWFVPTPSIMQNPGSTCNIYWNYSGTNYYWTDSQTQATLACIVRPATNTAVNDPLTATWCVRSFRCVAY